MRVLLQRVRSGSVHIDQVAVGQIGAGLVLLVGAGPADTPALAQKMAEKIVHLRIFPDDAGKMNRSLLETGGGVLVVSQFTLHADCRKGRRPSFTAAAAPDLAEPLVAAFTEALRDLQVAHVATGRFGADMLVQIENDGPVTLWLDSEALGM